MACLRVCVCVGGGGCSHINASAESGSKALSYLPSTTSYPSAHFMAGQGLTCCTRPASLLTQVYVVSGGFDGRGGWVQSKLQIKPAAASFSTQPPQFARTSVFASKKVRIWCAA